MFNRQTKQAARTALLIGASVGLITTCASIDLVYGSDDGVGSAVRARPLVLAQSTVPQTPEIRVSPTTPGTLPGTLAGPGTAVGTNSITGQPCLGGGSSAINGGIPGAPTTQGQPGLSGTQTTGLPPSNSVYGLNNLSNPGAC